MYYKDKKFLLVSPKKLEDIFLPRKSILGAGCSALSYTQNISLPTHLPCVLHGLCRYCSNVAAAAAAFWWQLTLAWEQCAMCTTTGPFKTAWWVPCCYNSWVGLGHLSSLVKNSYTVPVLGLFFEPFLLCQNKHIIYTFSIILLDMELILECIWSPLAIVYSFSCLSTISYCHKHCSSTCTFHHAHKHVMQTHAY